MKRRHTMMRQTTLTVRFLLLTSSVLLLTSACDRRLLEEYDYNYAQVRIDVDWDSYFTEKPTGMTVMLFDALGQNPNTAVTNNIRSTDFTLGPGHYQTVIFNQSFDEFGSMRFERTDEHQHIAVRSTNIQTYDNDDWDRGVVYMREPEAIGVAIDTFSVTHDMLSQYITLRPHQPITRTEASTPTTRSVPEPLGDGLYVVRDTVYPMTAMLYIRVHIRGISNMRSVIGSINGMANGFYLSQIWRTAETGTLLLDNWQKGDSDDKEGWVTTSIPTFGLPHGKELERLRDSTDNVLHLHFTLTDGSTRDFQYNVGKHIKYLNEQLLVDEQGNLIPNMNIGIHLRAVLDLELVIEAPLFDIPELPDVTPSSGGGGSGFDAEVDPWDDGGTIDIGF